MVKRYLIVLCMILLVAGCSKGPAPKPAEELPADDDTGAVTPGPEPQAPPSGASLLPVPDRPYFYHLDNGEAAEEYYIRDGDRLIGAYNGKTYVTWFITGEGVWRPDPKGEGLLRYLPPVLKDNLSWKQTSGGEEVWFRLQARTDCSSWGNAGSGCWELTVLNRLERTIFRFASAEAVLHVWSDNLANPAESYTKSRDQRQPTAPPARQQMIAEGARLPDGPLPTVTQVTPAEFDQAIKAMLAKGGRPFLEVDLDGDGQPDRIEGRLGEWHAEPFYLFRGDGSQVWDWLLANSRQAPRHHSMEMIIIPGIARPTLLYQYGDPDGWRRISPRWLTAESIVAAWGWHPKLVDALGTGVQIDQDGIFVVSITSAELAGYSWTRRYELTPTSDSRAPYRATLLDEQAVPGAYPTDPADLLTAALMAKWFTLEQEVERYIPDPAVRTAFLGAVIKRSPYRPHKPEVGALTWKQEPGWSKAVPVITPGVPDPDGSADFEVKAGQYEGYNSYVGRIRFGRAPDGRLIITGFELTHTDFIY